MRDACIPAANGHFTAKALASLYDNLLGSLGLSGGGGGDSSNGNDSREYKQSHEPLLRRARVNEMRAYQVCAAGWRGVVSTFRETITVTKNSWLLSLRCAVEFRLRLTQSSPTSRDPPPGPKPI